MLMQHKKTKREDFKLTNVLECFSTLGTLVEFYAERRVLDSLFRLGYSFATVAALNHLFIHFFKKGVCK